MDKKGTEAIRESLNERAERILRAGKAGSTPMSEECRRQSVVIETYRTIPEAEEAMRNRTAKKAGSQGDEWRKTRVSWKSITYTQSEFRETVITFAKDKNLSRFVWRTAKMNGMNEITLSDVQKMLNAADETIWILGGEHEWMAEDPNKRKPTWIMAIDRKKQYAAMMRITEAGWAQTELRDITIRGEKMKQRVWTLKKGA